MHLSEGAEQAQKEGKIQPDLDSEGKEINPHVPHWIDKDRVTIVDFENLDILKADDPIVEREQTWAMECCQRVHETGQIKDFKRKDYGE